MLRSRGAADASGDERRACGRRGWSCARAGRCADARGGVRDAECGAGRVGGTRGTRTGGGWDAAAAAEGAEGTAAADVGWFGGGSVMMIDRVTCDVTRRE